MKGVQLSLKIASMDPETIAFCFLPLRAAKEYNPSGDKHSLMSFFCQLQISRDKESPAFQSETVVLKKGLKSGQIDLQIRLRGELYFVVELPRVEQFIGLVHLFID